MPQGDTGTTIQRWVLRDSLTISPLREGAPDAATADATFTVYDDSGCTNELGSETVDVTTTGATTADGIEVSSPGAYYWRVSYTGDQCNKRS